MVAIIHASCMDRSHGMPSLEAASVDHVITDPPYSAHVHTKGLRGGSFGNEIKTPRDLGFASMTPSLMYAVAHEAARVTRRWIILFSDMEAIGEWRRALLDAGLDYVRTGVWIKEGATPQFSGDRPGAGCEAVIIAHRRGKKRWNGGGRHALWSAPVVRATGDKDGAREHTTQKPLELMEALVREFTDHGETILDPFAGSGTTLVAAKRLGRVPFGLEVDAGYAEIATARLAGTYEQTALFGGG